MWVNYSSPSFPFFLVSRQDILDFGVQFHRIIIYLRRTLSIDYVLGKSHFKFGAVTGEQVDGFGVLLNISGSPVGDRET